MHNTPATSSTATTTTIAASQSYVGEGLSYIILYSYSALGF